MPASDKETAALKEFVNQALASVTLSFSREMTAFRESLERGMRQMLEDKLDGHLAKLEGISDKVRGLEDCVYGKDNDGGLRIAVDRLEQQSHRQRWFLQLISGTLITSIVAGIVAAFWK